MQAVVLAGGLATRMRPRTLTVPKILLEVHGRPFVDWQLAALRRDGYDDVVLCVAHLGERVRAHVGDGAKHGLRVRYSDEGPNLLGTGGALRAALDLLEPTFLVTYGDSYLPFDYAGPLRLLDAHDARDCSGVMSVFENRGAWDVSNVETDGTWVQRYVKGRPDLALPFIDYGALALRREVVARVAPDVASGLDLVQAQLASARLLRAYVAHARFFEIGSPEGLSTLEAWLARGGADASERGTPHLPEAPR